MPIAALVLGIVGLVFSILPCMAGVIGLVCDVLAIIFGVLGKRAATSQGMAKAGFIMGIVGIAIVVLWWILIFAVGVTFMQGMGEAIQEMERQQQNQSY